MSEKLKSWGTKLLPNQIEISEKAIELYHKLNPTKEELKRDAIENIMKDYLIRHDELILPIKESPEILYKEEIDLPSLCPANFLQKLIDQKDDKNKWYCLRAINPKSRGKPFLIGDGKDLDSVRKYCEACKRGHEILEAERETRKTIIAIKKFGDTEISTDIFCCVHPDKDYIQLVSGFNSEIICELRKKRVRLDKVCREDIVNPCEFLRSTPLTIKVKETEAYQDFQKALPEKTT